MVFRGCSKCQGDVYVERNIDGADLVCLQCGSRRMIAASQVPANEPVSDEGWNRRRAAR
jgi:DNA-directed RNA polymerase subunit RPC12/RpoP